MAEEGENELSWGPLTLLGLLRQQQEQHCLCVLKTLDSFFLSFAVFDAEAAAALALRLDVFLALLPMSGLSQRLAPEL